jgi:hypothetical protein
MYKARDRQQQQSASHLVKGGPLLSQYNDHNHSSQYPTYQPPGSQEFIIDPTRLHPLPDLDYSIGSSIEPCTTDAVMSTPVVSLRIRPLSYPFNLRYIQHPPSIMFQNPITIRATETRGARRMRRSDCRDAAVEESLCGC